MRLANMEKLYLVGNWKQIDMDLSSFLKIMKPGRPLRIREVGIPT